LLNVTSLTDLPELNKGSNGKAVEFNRKEYEDLTAKSAKFFLFFVMLSFMKRKSSQSFVNNFATSRLCEIKKYLTAKSAKIF